MLASKAGWLGPVLALSLVAGALGCGDGGGSPEKDAIDKVVTTLQEALETGDVDSVCRLTTPAVHKQFSSSGHGTDAPCFDSFNRVLLMVEEQLLESRKPTVEDVSVDGDDATATLATADGTRFSVPFERRGGRWRLSNFYGSETLPEVEPESPATFRTGPATVASLEGTAVTGTESARFRGRYDFDVRTPIGTFTLGSCEVGGILRLDGDRAAIEEMAVSGDNPCNDLQPCKDRTDTRKTPWTGSLTTEDDGYRGDAAVCLDTCVGRFRGKAIYEVRRSGESWRLTFQGSPVGSGALAVSGDATLSGFDIP